MRWKISLLVMSVFIALLAYEYFNPRRVEGKDTHITVRSIDTMKFSRDVARAKLNDPTYDEVIDLHVRRIAGLGATHVAIATPYDEEFVPFLERWVASARKHKLKVWFRGNFSGWEEWFEYPEIDRAEHIRKTEAFILKNKDLFENGDIFTSCPECENGGPGDPRSVDPEGFKQFLIDEYLVTNKAFEKINKNVTTNYYSMNGDVARLIMDKETTAALDGIVTIDHYVESPEQLIADIKEYAARSGGKVVLGEIGVPIPDIHGDMTQAEQARWMAETFALLENTEEVVGMNYWVDTGGSTALWDNKGDEKEIAQVVKNFYTGRTVPGKIETELGTPVSNATITSNGKSILSDEDGTFHVTFIYKGQKVEISAPGYNPQSVIMENGGRELRVMLTVGENKQKKESFLDKVWNILTWPFTLFTSPEDNK